MAALNKDAVVVVIGAGAMGSGIAQIAAVAGHPVRLFDTRDGAATAAIATTGKTLAKLAEKGKMSAEAATQATARLSPMACLGDAAGAALVVEAIVEDLTAKQSLFTELAAHVGDACILATNTSSISVTAIARGIPAPERVVGMHFFNPAPLMALVEVVSGLATEQSVADTVFATAAAWGKAPVHAKSSPGFIVNRVARPFYAEGLRLLQEGAAAPATIDALLREAGGFRMGPFELMDLIGHDVNFAVTRSVFEAYFNDQRFLPSLIQQELVAAGRLGRKSGQGFYRYGETPETPQPDILPAGPRPSDVRVLGDLGPARALTERFRTAGLRVAEEGGIPRFPHGALAVGDVFLALSDGRSATARSAETWGSALVLFDLALDYATCKRIGIACADQTADANEDAVAVAAGLFQAAGIAVSQLDDIPGLAVLRTVAMLANEAADAVNQGVCTAADADMAMMKGVNYPLGPLAWADRIGIHRVADVLTHLAAHYGEDRYRVSPLIRRKVWSGKGFHD
ncbi:MAG: 3-hydroxyacyl-CoA dehydrogenase PaaC [Rhodocyclaceae bacterium]|nr:3-hydroxyacyl-CoA dehydrogenase PaaC [Rhodocyclaceae bacterium]